MSFRKSGNEQEGCFWGKGWGDSRKGENTWQSPDGWRAPAFNRQPWFGKGESGVAERDQEEVDREAGTQELTVPVGRSSTVFGPPFPHPWHGVMRHSLPDRVLGKIK